MGLKANYESDCTKDESKLITEASTKNYLSFHLELSTVYVRYL